MHAYLPVIIPGILVLPVITASGVTGVQLREDMDKGVFDRFKPLPIARISPQAGLLSIVCSWPLSWIFAFFGVIARTASGV